MPNSKIAPSGRGVKRPFAASQKDTRDGYSRRPDVLAKMPPSCNVTFDVLRTYAMGETAKISVQELAEVCRLSTRQVRRALARLHGARLIRWERGGPGRGNRSTVVVLWRSPAQTVRNRLWGERDVPTPTRLSRRAKEAASAGLASSSAARGSLSVKGASFPQEKGAPQESRSEACSRSSHPYRPRERNCSLAKARTREASSATQPSQLKGGGWQPSERAVRWALARARDRLWGLPRPRRERAVEALARAFRQAARQPGPWDRDRWRRFVFSTIAKFEAGPAGFTASRRRPYSWAALCAKDALGELANREAAFKATEELLDQIRRDREAARGAWARLTAAPSLAGQGACPAGPLVQPRSLPGERGGSGVHRAPGCSQGAIPPAGSI